MPTPIESVIKQNTLRGCGLTTGDFNTPSGWQKAEQTGQFTGICPILVRDALEFLKKRLDPA